MIISRKPEPDRSAQSDRSPDYSPQVGQPTPTASDLPLERKTPEPPIGSARPPNRLPGVTPQNALAFLNPRGDPASNEKRSARISVHRPTFAALLTTLPLRPTRTAPKASPNRPLLPHLATASVVTHSDLKPHRPHRGRARRSLPANSASTPNGPPQLSRRRPPLPTKSTANHVNSVHTPPKFIFPSP
jgi:hypothetical protein